MQAFGNIIFLAIRVILGAVVAGVVDHRPPKAFAEILKKHDTLAN